MSTTAEAEVTALKRENAEQKKVVQRMAKRIRELEAAVKSRDKKFARMETAMKAEIGAKHRRIRQLTPERKERRYLIFKPEEAYDKTALIMAHMFRTDSLLKAVAGKWHGDATSVVALFLQMTVYNLLDQTESRVAPGKKVGSVRIAENYEVQFEVKTMGYERHRGSAAWPMLFRIGESDGERMPAVFVMTGTSGLHIRQATRRGPNTAVCADGAVVLPIGHWSRLLLGFYEDRSARVVFNGTQISAPREFDWLFAKKEGEMPVYIAPEYGGGYASHAYIRNLVVRTW